MEIETGMVPVNCGKQHRTKAPVSVVNGKDKQGFACTLIVEADCKKAHTS